MAGKKAAGENSKKAAGNARKADAAARKQADKDAVDAAAEDEKWSKGSKSNAKKDAAEEKRRKQLDAKASKAALEAEEAASLPSKPKSSGKTAQKKTSAAPSRGTLDLSKLDDDDEGPAAALNASGLDNALDALKLTSRTQDKIDRHPERRYKAAFIKFKEAREGSDDFVGLNRSQRDQAIKKEFDKSPENPMNQLHGAFNSSKTDMADLRAQDKAAIEKRLAGK